MRLRSIATVVVPATLLVIGHPALGLAMPASTAPTCMGHRATIVGTGHRDVLHGTRHSDVIVARGGADTIRGGGDDDDGDDDGGDHGSDGVAVSSARS